MDAGIDRNAAEQTPADASANTAARTPASETMPGAGAPVSVCTKTRLVVPSEGRSPVGADVVALPVAAIPSELATKFRNCEPFAIGATATLFRAIDVASGSHGLLKILHASGSDAGIAAELASSRARMARELAKLPSLPNANLPLPTSTGQLSDGTIWMFRELINGLSLAILLKQGPLPLRQALAIASSVAQGLDDIHRAGLLHRDVKPAHIILTPSGAGYTVSLIDTALPGHTRSIRRAPIEGTAAYIAPELVKGAAPSFRADLYALGSVLFEMLTGAAPYNGDDDTILTAQAQDPLPEFPATVPGPVVSLVRSLLAKEAKERPFSAQQVRRTLVNALDSAQDRPSRRSLSELTASEAGPSDDTTTSGPSLQRSSKLPPPPPPAATRASTPPQSFPSVTATLVGTPLSELRGAALANSGLQAAPVAELSASDLNSKLALDAIDELAAKVASTRSDDDFQDATAVQSLSELGFQPLPPIVDTHVLTMTSDDDSHDATAQFEDLDATASFGEDYEELKSDIAILPLDAAHDASPTSLELPPVMATSTPSSSGFNLGAPQAPPPSAPQAVFASGVFPSSASPPTSAMASGASATNAHTSSPSGNNPFPNLTRESAPPPLSSSASGFPPSMAMQPPSNGTFGTPQMPLPGSAWGKEADRGSFAPPGSWNASGGMSATSLTPPVYSTSVAPPAGSKWSGGKIAAVAGGVLGIAAAIGVGIFVTTRDSGQETAAATAEVAPQLALATQPTVSVPAAADKQAQPQVKIEQDQASAAAIDEALAQSAARAAAEQQAAVAAAEREAAAASRAQAAQEEAARAAAAEASRREARATEERAASERAASVRAAEARAREERSREAQAAAQRAREAEAQRAAASRTDRQRDARHARRDTEGAFNSLREEARGHFAARRYREAASAYERAAAMNPSHAGTYAGLAATRLAMNDARGAISAYLRAVQLSPQTSGFHAALGRAYLAGGDRSRARAAFQQALALDPNNGAARDALSRL